jgi:hypothetical protein
VAGEERLAVLLEILLVRIKHAIQPRQKLLGAMVGVQDNRDTVGGSDRADVVGTSNCTGNRSLLVLIVDTLLTRQESISHHARYFMYLSCEVCGTALGHLEDNRCTGITGSFEGSNDGGGRGNVLIFVSVCQLTVSRS